MSESAEKDSGHKSVNRAKIRHVFARQRGRVGLKVRMIGVARAKAAISG